MSVCQEKCSSYGWCLGFSWGISSGLSSTTTRYCQMWQQTSVSCTGGNTLRTGNVASSSLQLKGSGGSTGYNCMAKMPTAGSATTRRPTGAEYVQQSLQSGCCKSAGVFHQRCSKYGTVTSSACKAACVADSNCKGYAVLSNGNCQIATTSSCASGWSQGFVGNVGSLNATASCGSSSLYTGCYIRQSSTTG